MKAILRNYRQSPRKVRLVADAVRGKHVDDALRILATMPKRASEAVTKVVASAVANARENFHKNTEDLIVGEIRVDEGVILKRWMPRAFGRASRINKRTSHISVALAEKTDLEKLSAEEAEEKPKKAAAKKSAKATKKEEEKVTA